MLGVDRADLDRLPKWLQAALGDVLAAQTRVDAVIKDEVGWLASVIE
jgi:hypothetical protein